MVYTPREGWAGPDVGSQVFLYVWIAAGAIIAAVGACLYYLQLSVGLWGRGSIDPVGVVLSIVGILLGIELLDLVPAYIKDLLRREGKISKAFPVAPERVARLLEGMLDEMGVAFRREGPVDDPGIDVGDYEAIFRVEADVTTILVEDAGASTVVHIGQRRRPGEGGSLDGFAEAVDQLLEGGGG